MRTWEMDDVGPIVLGRGKAWKGLGCAIKSDAKLRSQCQFPIHDRLVPTNGARKKVRQIEEYDYS